MDERTVFGIDFGSTNVAYAALSSNTHEADFLKFKGDIEPLALYQTIGRFLLPKFENRHPDSKLFIESVFYGINKKTYARMTIVGYTVRLIAEQNGIETQFIDNNAWRRTLFGKGNIKKEECQVRASKIWDVEDDPKGSAGHKLDALCVAAAGKILITPESERGDRSGNIAEAAVK